MTPEEKRAALLDLKERLGQGRLIPEKRKPFTPDQKRQIAAKSEGLCAGCGGPPGLSPEFDHIICRNWGGPTTVENGELLCKPCHTEKSRSEAPDHARIRRLEDIELNGRPPGRIPGRPFEKPKQRKAWPKQSFGKRPSAKAAGGEPRTAREQGKPQ